MSYRNIIFVVVHIQHAVAMSTSAGSRPGWRFAFQPPRSPPRLWRCERYRNRKLPQLEGRPNNPSRPVARTVPLSYKFLFQGHFFLGLPDIVFLLFWTSDKMRSECIEVE